jgi:acyl-coenzyme A thioesterase PaaI-like protein
MRLLRKANWKLWLFAVVKIPMINFCRPRITELSDASIKVKIKLRRRTRNHLNSMYLGVMAVGADLASGMLAFHHMDRTGIQASLIFKDMKVQYLKRAESDVFFCCDMGAEVRKMLTNSKESGERQTEMIKVLAKCGEEVVAEFDLGLSLKVITNK